MSLVEPNSSKVYTTSGSSGTAFYTLLGELIRYSNLFLSGVLSSPLAIKSSIVNSYSKLLKACSLSCLVSS